MKILRKIALFLLCTVIITNNTSANLFENKYLERLPESIQNIVSSDEFQTRITEITSSEEQTTAFLKAISNYKKKNTNLSDTKKNTLLYLESIFETANNPDKPYGRKIYYSSDLGDVDLESLGLKIDYPKEWGDLLITRGFSPRGPTGINISFNTLPKLEDFYSLKLDSYSTALESNKEVLPNKGGFVGFYGSNILDLQKNIEDICIQNCIEQKRINVGGKEIIVSTFAYVYGDVNLDRQYTYIFKDKKISLTRLLSTEDSLDFNKLMIAYENRNNDEISLQKVGLTKETLKEIDNAAIDIFKNIHFQTTFSEKEIQKQKKALDAFYKIHNK